MNDEPKTKQQLIAELAELQQQLNEKTSQLMHSQRAEAEQQQIKQNLPVLVATAGVDGYYKEVNAAFEKTLGWSELESLSRPFIEFIHPDDRAAALQVFEQLRAGQTVVDFVDRNICKDGTCRWINWTVIPVPGRDIVYGIGMDITQRQQAEASLREAKEFNERLIASMNDGLAVFDTGGVHVEVNDAFCHMTGFERDELIGVGPPHPYWPPEHRDDCQQILPRIGAKEQEQVELTLMRKSGERFPVIVAPSQTTIRGGRALNYLATFKDFSERKDMEQRLEESERRLSTLISNLPGAVYRCKASEDWAIEFLSDGYLELTGYDPTALIGQPGMRHSELIQPDDRRREYEVVEQAIAEKKAFEVEYRLRKASGEERWLWERGQGVFSETGELLAIEGFTTDITAQKQAELELRKTRVELEHRVAERTAELTTANEELLKSEAKYKALLESSPDAIVMYDLNGTITFASRQAAKRHRVEDPSELIGRPATDLVVEQNRDLMQQRIRSLLETGIRRNDEYVALRMDGTTFFSEASGAIIRDAAGNPESFMAVYRDITERKESQASLYRMLQASGRERELISYEIHDGVAQQLLGAKMCFEAILQSGGNIAEEAMPRFEAGLAALTTAAAETRHLINRTRTPVLQKFGVRPALAEFVDQLNDQHGTPEIVYHCEARFERLEPVLEDTIFRVAQEAITNARNHGKARKILVSMIQRDETLIVEVRDDGVGFDKQEVKENRFGLHGIRERVRLLGKGLKIDSEPGKGTRIEAIFPLVHRNEEADSGQP